MEKMTKNIAKVKSLRSRKLGSGRKTMMDEDEERYLASRIVYKASAMAVGRILFCMLVDNVIMVVIGW